MTLKDKFPLIILRKMYHRWWARTEFREVPLSICMTFTGFSFGRQGWHHLIELLREIQREPDLPLEQTILYRFHERYRPEGMYELVRHRGEDIQFRMPLGIFPWGSFRIGFGLGDTLEGKVWERSRFCGPTPYEVILAEFNSFLALYQDIKIHGYQPWKRGFIGGTLLQRRDGDRRFVVLQGNHRAAILSYLGYDSILVGPVKGRYRVIDERDVATWHHVKAGRCSKNDALAYFNAFFELTGFEQAKRFGLLS